LLTELLSMCNTKNYLRESQQNTSSVNKTKQIQERKRLFLCSSSDLVVEGVQRSSRYSRQHRWSGKRNVIFNPDTGVFITGMYNRAKPSVGIQRSRNYTCSKNDVVIEGYKANSFTSFCPSAETVSEGVLPAQRRFPIPRRPSTKAQNTGKARAFSFCPDQDTVVEGVTWRGRGFNSRARRTENNKPPVRYRVSPDLTPTELNAHRVSLSKMPALEEDPSTMECEPQLQPELMWKPASSGSSEEPASDTESDSEPEGSDEHLLPVSWRSIRSHKRRKVTRSFLFLDALFSFCFLGLKKKSSDGAPCLLVVRSFFKCEEKASRFNRKPRNVCDDAIMLSRKPGGALWRPRCLNRWVVWCCFFGQNQSF
jgi:hypothetical protein